MMPSTYFSFPEQSDEMDFIFSFKQTCYDSSFYPFKVLSTRGLQQLDFEPITILYGGNGSGKSTALNVIAEKIHAARDSLYNKTYFYPDYLRMCETNLPYDSENSRIITSDDVFHHLLTIRSRNQEIDHKKEALLKEYSDVKYSQVRFDSLADYEQFKRMNQSRRKTQSQFVKDEHMATIPTYSNGESAFRFFTEKITENRLYLLDEPENSLSPKLQVELVRFLEDSVRFFGCRFILSTHSPFLLALQGAKIYDLDQNPVAVKYWTELENVQIYLHFFRSKI